MSQKRYIQNIRLLNLLGYQIPLSLNAGACLGISCILSEYDDPREFFELYDLLQNKNIFSLLYKLKKDNSLVDKLKTLASSIDTMQSRQATPSLPGSEIANPPLLQHLENRLLRKENEMLSYEFLRSPSPRDMADSLETLNAGDKIILVFHVHAIHVRKLTATTYMVYDPNETKPVVTENIMHAAEYIFDRTQATAIQASGFKTRWEFKPWLLTLRTLYHQLLPIRELVESVRSRRSVERKVDHHDTVVQCHYMRENPEATQQRESSWLGMTKAMTHDSPNSLLINIFHTDNIELYKKVMPKMDIKHDRKLAYIIFGMSINKYPLEMATALGAYKICEHILNDESAMQSLRHRSPDIIDTLVCDAATYNYQAIVTLLLNHTTTANIHFKNGKSLLEDCVVNGHVNIFNLLIRRINELHSHIENGPKLMKLAIEHGHPAMIKTLKECNIPFPSSKDTNKLLHKLESKNPLAHALIHKESICDNMEADEHTSLLAAEHSPQHRW